MYLLNLFRTNRTLGMGPPRCRKVGVTQSKTAASATRDTFARSKHNPTTGKKTEQAPRSAGRCLPTRKRSCRPLPPPRPAPQAVPPATPSPPAAKPHASPAPLRRTPAVQRRSCDRTKKRLGAGYGYMATCRSCSLLRTTVYPLILQPAGRSVGLARGRAVDEKTPE